MLLDATNLTLMCSANLTKAHPVTAQYSVAQLPLTHAHDPHSYIHIVPV
jgi:hypothetical protein